MVQYHYLNQWWLVYPCICAPLGLNELMHWGRNKMDPIAHTRSNAYSVVFWIQFPSTLFIDVKLAYVMTGSAAGLAPSKPKVIHYLNQWWCSSLSPGLNSLHGNDVHFHTMSNGRIEVEFLIHRCFPMPLNMIVTRVNCFKSSGSIIVIGSNTVLVVFDIHLHVGPLPTRSRRSWNFLFGGWQIMNYIDFGAKMRWWIPTTVRSVGFTTRLVRLV